MSHSELFFIAGLAIALFAIGLVLSFMARSSLKEESLDSRLEKILPGVQCAQCGFPGCAAYAKAMAAGQAPCNKCTPGGPDTARELAAVLGLQVTVDMSDDMLFTPPRTAFIHQSLCTGCTRCTRVCPVDAIAGKIKEPHKVNPALCIACNECVKVCPEKCIEMISQEHSVKYFNWDIKSVTTGGTH